MLKSYSNAPPFMRIIMHMLIIIIPQNVAAGTEKNFIAVKLFWQTNVLHKSGSEHCKEKTFSINKANIFCLKSCKQSL
jgi:hypothetical protein